MNKLVFAFTAFFMFSAVANAAFVNPNPAVLGNDTGAEEFAPLTSTLFVTAEALDIGATVTPSVFGFYFAGTDPTNPANRVDLFGPAIHNTTPGQSLLVDLATGVVFNNNTASVQSLFSALGGVIGFFYELPLVNNTFFYSQSFLNAGSVDYFGFFPVLNTTGAMLIDIQLPDGTTLAFELAVNLVAVPEPATTMLLAIALFFFGFYEWHKKSRLAPRTF